MIYLVIGILGIAVFMKDTIMDILENMAAHTFNFLDKAWNRVFN